LIDGPLIDGPLIGRFAEIQIPRTFAKNLAEKN